MLPQPDVQASAEASTSRGPRTGPPPRSHRRKDGQPPRPPNAWICYRAERSHALRLQPEYARVAQSEISKIVARLWREETPEVRRRYELEAQELKRQHREKYPNYIYSRRTRESTTKTAKKEARDTTSESSGGLSTSRACSATAPTISETDNIALPVPPVSAVSPGPAPVVPLHRTEAFPPMHRDPAGRQAPYPGFYAWDPTSRMSNPQYAPAVPGDPGPTYPYHLPQLPYEHLPIPPSAPPPSAQQYRTISAHPSAPSLNQQLPYQYGRAPGPPGANDLPSSAQRSFPPAPEQLWHHGVAHEPHTEVPWGYVYE